ncbi:YbhB/YbcL family Raf kinase inhibitor-like protein [Candidatus Amarolinea aalborgensis]|mgnify:CR=1 FL=1|jgi:Raf kinase inhibitor-like YbhB/YbcL family protein|uniref:YbhB/YbcL family Raf kinase inhibitor-like protein n=1 Tax=Candidatus Amarolinea aalborgensis TaxID=2249329 RepID=UPI003BF975E8
MAFILQTAAFRDEGLIPARFTCDGANVSPALSWRGAPAGVQSFVLIMDDPDAPRGTWTHWTLFNLPGALGELAEGWRPGASGLSGRNDFGSVGYGGPCPPRGHGPHRYFFRLYALAVAALPLRAGAARPELERSLAGHVIGQAQMMGRYERK